MLTVSASLEHACLQSLIKVLDSPWHRFLKKVIPGHLQSRATLLDCWWLTVVFILSTRLQNCNANYLRKQFNSETCRRCYLTNARWLCLLQDGAPAHRAFNARLVTRHCNDFLAKYEWPTNCQILICLIIMSAVPCWKPITSWTSKPPSTEELQTMLEMIWYDLPQKPVVTVVHHAIHIFSQ